MLSLENKIKFPTKIKRTYLNLFEVGRFENFPEMKNSEYSHPFNTRVLIIYLITNHSLIDVIFSPLHDPLLDLLLDFSGAFFEGLSVLACQTV